MKKVALLVTILALAMCASAQQLIDFTHLPDGNTPASIPENYAGMHWANLDGVDALKYADAGAGFFTGNEAMVAFGGGPLCFPNYGGVNNDGAAFKNICDATISVGVGPNALATFQALKATVSAGWTDGSIVVTAYNNGVQAGASQKYTLTTNAKEIDFPNNWGQITQLVIHPSPLGSFVMYTLQVN
jgi:hypothetical protein